MATDDKIEVWKKAVDVDIFNPKYRSAEMRALLTDGHPEDKVIVNIGRLGFEKNILFLKEIYNKIPGIRLALVGDGPAKKYLEKEFKGTRTVFTGMLHGEELSQAYASGDVFVMPSETETLGFVVMESMASGVPVVGVRAGGIPDMISSPGENGFLYDRGNVEMASNQVKGLLLDD